jgi:hypothetical protein
MRRRTIKTPRHLRQVRKLSHGESRPFAHRIRCLLWTNGTRPNSSIYITLPIRPKWPDCEPSKISSENWRTRLRTAVRRPPTFSHPIPPCSHLFTLRSACCGPGPIRLQPQSSIPPSRSPPSPPTHMTGVAARINPLRRSLPGNQSQTSVRPHPCREHSITKSAAASFRPIRSRFRKLKSCDNVSNCSHCKSGSLNRHFRRRRIPSPRRILSRTSSPLRPET